jgi:hypothetical protein
VSKDRLDISAAGAAMLSVRNDAAGWAELVELVERLSG